MGQIEILQPSGVFANIKIVLSDLAASVQSHSIAPVQHLLSPALCAIFQRQKLNQSTDFHTFCRDTV